MKTNVNNIRKEMDEVGAILKDEDGEEDTLFTWNVHNSIHLVWSRAYILRSFMNYVFIYFTFREIWATFQLILCIIKNEKKKKDWLIK